jgi:DNA-binding NtrC family response regulator
LRLSAQASLLRAIETQRICRLGSPEERRIDVHVVAATHCDLEAMVDEGTFRRDLFFRLNGIRFEVPPLRERVDEIAPLARLFLERTCRDWNLGAREFVPAALEVLERCPWPGNVRQLRYAVERAALLASDTRITAAELPDYVTEGSIQRSAQPAVVAPHAPELGLKQQLRRYERLLIDDALRRAGGNRQAAAKLLRIPLRTLFRKMRGPEPTAVELTRHPS